MKFAATVMILFPLAVAAQTPAEPYRALGTEPFWGLTIDGRTMRLDQPGVRPVVVTAPGPSPSFNGRRYVTPAMTVDITAGDCSDGMSDRRYPERVTVTLGRHVLRGCGGEAVAQPVRGQRLEGGRWTITAIDGRRVALDGADLHFDGGTVAGSAGCNRLSAPYALDGTMLRVGSVRATRMACAGPAMAAETRVLAIVAQPVRVRWIGRDAVLLAAREGGIVLRRIYR